MKTPSVAAQELVKQAVKINAEVLSLSHARNKLRQKAVKLLLSEGFSYREIGARMGLSGQRVGALIRYWRRCPKKA